MLANFPALFDSLLLIAGLTLVVTGSKKRCLR